MSNQDTEKFQTISDSNAAPEHSFPAENGNFTRQSQTEIAELSRRIDEQTRYFDVILSSISDFAYTFDKDGRFVFVNQALLDLWGLKLEQAIGKNFFDLEYPVDLAARLQEQIQQVFDTKQRVTDETPYTSPSGKVGYYEYIFNPFLGADGSVELVVGTTRNITKRNRAEEEIKKLSNLNREILESITDAFFAIDEDWRFTYVNKQAEQMLDREPGDLIGKVIWEIYPGLMGSEFEKAYRRAANERISSIVTAFYPDHDRWYEVNVYPASNGITIYFKNVTERLKTEKSLRESEEQYRTLFNSIDEGFCTIELLFDEEGKAYNYLFLEYNPVFENLTGLHNAAGKTALELVPDLEKKWFEIYGNVALTGEPVRFEDNSEPMNRWFDVYASRIGEEPSRKVALVFTNITERKRMENTLREGDRRKDEFLATLAHELRNPLAPIRSGLEVIRHVTDDPEKFYETLEIIERQTNQIVHLVDDLLDISRITQGKIKLRLERIELTTAIKMALETSQELIDKSENELTIFLPEKPIFITADLTRTTQIFLNILNNAAKYSDRGGKISLTAKAENGNAVISIKDTGLGIEPEMLAKIFDMFGQIETPYEQARGGLGIGLSVVEKLVEMHGGTIEAFSEGRGKGSEFIVRLPLAAEQSPAIPAAIHSEDDIIQKAQMKMPEQGNQEKSSSRILCEAF